MLLPMFPTDKHNIDTAEFLAASQGVVNLIDKCGRAFASVKYDMQSNIDTLLKRYNLNKQNYSTLDKLFLTTKNDNKHAAIAEAFLWLKRNLELVLVFFERIVLLHRSGDLTDNLSHPLKVAYKESLEAHHNWMAQHLFALLSRVVISRKQLLEVLSNNNDNWDSVIEMLVIFNGKLRSVLQYNNSHGFSNVE